MTTRVGSFCVKWFIPDSTLTTISVAGILVGLIAKFSPFCSSETSVSLKGLEDKLTTHLFLSIQGVLVGKTEDCFFCNSL